MVLTTTKFDRFARNMVEAGEILTSLRERDVLFGLGSQVYDWADPFGKLFLQTLAMVAEFEANLNHLRTREGMAKARTKGRLKGKQPKLPLAARKTIHRRYHDPEDDASLADLAEEYSVGHPPHHQRSLPARISPPSAAGDTLLTGTPASAASVRHRPVPGVRSCPAPGITLDPVHTEQPPSDAEPRIWGGTTLTERREARRAALLEAALDLIGESGAGAVTMRAVCRRANLTDRYFYESFASRDELLDVLYRQIAEEFLDPMTAFAVADDPDRDRALSETLVDKVLEDPRKSRLFLVEPYSSTGLGQTTIAVMPAFTRLIQDHLFGHIADPVRRRLAAVTMASGNAGMFSAWLNGTLRATREQIIDHLVETIDAYRGVYRD
ncbi:recombinase family protein [Nocardia niigatensis]|uniref:recombinase family protein n=1 Tax=Nocardia niigatensis TaxID=209249 RepID=UPI0024787566|nr:recombinase family protein [Nocardia niigatensis]